MDKKTIVIGVIGADAHAVGNKIIDLTLTNSGFNVVNLGVMVSQEEFIDAAVETNADAILVSSLYGHGEIDCMGLRQKCDEAGLKEMPLFVGGNLVVGKQNFDDVKQRFLSMGFDFVYPPSTPIEETIIDLKKTLGILNFYFSSFSVTEKYSHKKLCLNNYVVEEKYLRNIEIFIILRRM